MSRIWIYKTLRLRRIPADSDPVEPIEDEDGFDITAEDGETLFMES